jgi:ectoine hydroxylase-related dioxygenase (phytanoyl-CoA dioxygenase family)
MEKSIDHNEIISSYKNDGFILLRNFFDESELGPYLDKHNSKIHGSTDWTKSYLDSWNSFANDETIHGLLCGEKINNIFSVLNLKMRIILSEARLGSSNISWHRDVHYKAPENMHYSVVSIAMSDATENAGWISYVPGSHLWDVDYGIVGGKATVEDPQMCFDYYADLIKTKNAEVRRFDSRKGDVLIWNGFIVHKGEDNEKSEKALRHSLNGHFRND